jgi:hypothetical protein
MAPMSHKVLAELIGLSEQSVQTALGHLTKLILV